MAERSVRDTVLPRGPEGLIPEGGWKEGDPLVSPEALAAVQEEAGRVRMLDTAAAVARGEGTRAAEAVLAREKDSKAGQLFAFKSFLRSLEDLAGRDASAVANPEETRLVLRLYRLEENGGPKPTALYQTAVSFAAAEAMAMGDPDFEGRAQAWAEKTGRFGRYQWRVLGWAAGEQTLDTTYNVQVEPPSGYVAPAAPVEVASEALRDPMANLREGLALIGIVKETLGQPAAGKVDVDGIRASARLEALMEADRQRREEIQRLEDRWETKAEAARQEAYNRGVTDGRRTTEDEWRPKVWELERKVNADREPSLLEEAAKLVGGPEVVSQLAQAVITSMANPRPAPPPRPQVVPLQVRPNPPQPAAPEPAAQPMAILPEPSRAEWRQAMADTEEALEVLDEHGDGSAEVRQLETVLKAFVTQGEAEGTLGPWWQAWGQGIGQAVQDMLAAAEVSASPETQEESMDLDGMKVLLAQRLDEGAGDAAILEELDRLTTPAQRNQWRSMMGWVPTATAAALLGEERHLGRLTSLVQAFLGQEG